MFRIEDGWAIFDLSEYFLTGTDDVCVLERWLARLLCLRASILDWANFHRSNRVRCSSILLSNVFKQLVLDRGRIVYKVSLDACCQIFEYVSSSREPLGRCWSPCKIISTHSPSPCQFSTRSRFSRANVRWGIFFCRFDAESDLVCKARCSNNPLWISIVLENLSHLRCRTSRARNCPLTEAPYASTSDTTSTPKSTFHRLDLTTDKSFLSFWMIFINTAEENTASNSSNLGPLQSSNMVLRTTTSLPKKPASLRAYRRLNTADRRSDDCFGSRGGNKSLHSYTFVKLEVDFKNLSLLRTCLVVFESYNSNNLYNSHAVQYSLLFRFLMLSVTVKVSVSIPGQSNSSSKSSNRRFLIRRSGFEMVWLALAATVLCFLMAFGGLALKHYSMLFCHSQLEEIPCAMIGCNHVNGIYNLSMSLIDVSKSPPMSIKTNNSWNWIPFFNVVCRIKVSHYFRNTVGESSRLTNLHCKMRPSERDVGDRVNFRKY